MTYKVRPVDRSEEARKRQWRTDELRRQKRKRQTAEAEAHRNAVEARDAATLERLSNMPRVPEAELP